MNPVRAAWIVNRSRLGIRRTSVPKVAAVPEEVTPVFNDAACVKFAIIGCGRIAGRHVEAVLAQDCAECVALCDIDTGRAAEIASKFNLRARVYANYHDMLKRERVDVVSIMTPSGMHAEHAVEIAEVYGKHLVVEKPLALRLTDARSLVDACAKKGVCLFPVHQNRFNGAVQALRGHVARNVLGDIIMATVRIRWSRPQRYYDQAPWRGTWALDGGVLANQGIHYIDLLRWLAGDVESVCFRGRAMLARIEAEDTAVGWLRFTNGAGGAVEATTAMRPDHEDQEASVSLLGSRGPAIVDGPAANRLRLYADSVADNVIEVGEEFANVYGVGHNLLVRNVVETLMGKTVPLVTGEDALRSLQLLHACYASIEQDGREVFLADEPVSANLGRVTQTTAPLQQLYRTRAKEA